MAVRDRALINTTIVDSGASGWYFKPGAPVSRVNQAVEKIHVGTAVGHAVELAASCELPLPDIPPDLFGHIMPGFKHNLFGIGNLCDKDCRVVFTKRSVVIYDKTNRPFLTVWPIIFVLDHD